MLHKLKVCSECTDYLTVGDKIWNSQDACFCAFCDDTPTETITVKVGVDNTEMGTLEVLGVATTN